MFFRSKQHSWRSEPSRTFVPLATLRQLGSRIAVILCSFVMYVFDNSHSNVAVSTLVIIQEYNKSLLICVFEFRKSVYLSKQTLSVVDIDYRFV